MTAWTVLEEACEEALSTAGIGRRFKENLDKAVSNAGLPQIDWGSGIWQRVLVLRRARKSYVHPTGSPNLFSEVVEADFAIGAVRDAVKDIYARAGKQQPAWIYDDADRGWDGGMKGVAHATVIRRRANENPGDLLRITYIHEGKEYESEIRPYASDYEFLLDQLIASVTVPISEVRAYRGNDLLAARSLHTRGA